MSDALGGAVLHGYAAAAPDLLARYEALNTETMLAPVAGCLPDCPCRVLDVGAGTGRDAAWLAARGHAVWAVEPVAAFRRFGQARHLGVAQWIDDTLPALTRLKAERFDLILANGVWHHLPPDQQVQAVVTCAALLGRSGRLILSLRHGPTPTDRPGYPVDTVVLITGAARCGLSLGCLQAGLASHQTGNRRAGVTWDWVVLVRE